ncbi:MAG: PEP-CTERM sorting domain-containing protein [Planctomycetota bacterium]
MKHLVLTLMVTLISAPSVFATVVLDQAFDARATGVDGSTSIQAGQIVYQTFTVGVTGTLDSIDLQVLQSSQGVPAGDLVVDILGTTGGTPDLSNVLGSGSVVGTTLPPPSFDDGQFTNIDLSAAGIDVTVGEVLAFRVRPELAGDFFSLVDRDGLPPDYAGGSLYITRGIADPPNFAIDSDAGFRTYVTVIPEPTSAALLGFGGLLVARRRPHRSSDSSSRKTLL